ncbi:MAG: TetR/AcrR family transcriptional regulator [Pseudodonghicola sp.]
MTTKRRTQTERTEQTRTALIDATVALLMERGMQGATVQEICKRARVTTGAIQHHFGSKTGLIVEVVRVLFTPFVDRIAPAEEDELPLETRVERVIDHYWTLYGDERYFAVVEALLSARNDPELMEMIVGFRSRQMETLDQALTREFADVGLPAYQMRASLERMIDYLRGHALRRLFQADRALDHAAVAHARDMVLHDIAARRQGRPN